jgi:hypothetical protein
MKRWGAAKMTLGGRHLHTLNTHIMGVAVVFSTSVLFPSRQHYPHYSVACLDPMEHLCRRWFAVGLP